MFGRKLPPANPASRLSRPSRIYITRQYSHDVVVDDVLTIDVVNGEVTLYDEHGAPVGSFTQVSSWHVVDDDKTARRKRGDDVKPFPFAEIKPKGSIRSSG
jgi:hypothetical protein